MKRRYAGYWLKYGCAPTVLCLAVITASPPATVSAATNDGLLLPITTIVRGITGQDAPSSTTTRSTASTRPSNQQANTTSPTNDMNTSPAVTGNSSQSTATSTTTSSTPVNSASNASAANSTQTTTATASQPAVQSSAATTTSTAQTQPVASGIASDSDGVFYPNYRLSSAQTHRNQEIAASLLAAGICIVLIDSILSSIVFVTARRRRLHSHQAWARG